MMKPLFYIFLFVFSVGMLQAQTFQLVEQRYQNSYNKRNMDSCMYYAKQCLSIAEKTYTKKSKAYATATGYMASAFRMKGQLLEAEAYYIQSMELKKTMYGPTHVNYANALNNLATLLMDKGDYNQAEPLLQNAITIYKAEQGEQNAYYATALFNLGSCLYYQGNYSKAQMLYQDALAIKKSVLGRSHPDYANSLNNLAALYKKIGDYDRVEKLYIEALRIKEETSGPNSNEYALVLTNLATLYNDQKKYELSDSLYQLALMIQTNTIGEGHPDYTATLNSIAVLYNNMKDYANAKPIYEKVLEIRGQTLGTGHPSYANTLSYLANLYISTGDYDKAESKLMECYDIRKETLGKNHPDYAATLLNLATFYHETEEDDKAEPFYIENTQIRLHQLVNNFAFLSEKEKERFWSSLNNDFYTFNSFAADRYKTNPRIAEVMYNNQLATKGILFNSSVQIRNKIANSKDSTLIADLDKWLMLKENIGKMFQLKMQNIGTNKIDVGALERAANMMEKSLSEKSAVFAQERQQTNMTWKDVQSNLGDQEAVIEFIDFPYFKGQSFTDERYYYALVIRNFYEHPVLLRLCSEKELSNALADKQNKGVSPYIIDGKAREQLYKLIWHPIDSLLGNKGTVHLSLTGLLYRISFACLHDKSKNALLNRYDIHYINTSRDLAQKKPELTTAQKSFTCFGGINYDLDEETVKNKTNFYESKDITTSNNTSSVKSFENMYLMRYPLLEGTLKEAETIEPLFHKYNWNTSILQGNKGSEEAFKALKGYKSPTVIHLATHGFFFPFPKDSVMMKSDLGNFFLNSLNPLYRSGLILSGANYVWLGGQPIVGIEDGVLTAYEVANLNLMNTDLVVMSACQTGLGEIRSGEGVYGLQRSFQVAGAKSLIMSLWDIPDKETVELMKLFYTYWLDSGKKHEAFKKAQTEMFSRYKEPFFWAGFVLIE